uniref:Giant globin linker protein n=1 Tax=Platynereis dumerilii TaxID=6359 RepID=A0A7U1GJS9_PLADU|nr:giant globin linker protein [Platynereis dumerilii]
MIQLLCVLGLVVTGALAGALRPNDGCNCPNRPPPPWGPPPPYQRGPSADLAEGRLLNQEARLEQLESYFQGLVDKYEKYASGKDERIARWNILQDRVWGLEAHHCDDEHFSCRDNTYSCIGHNLVCDGDQDCLNGRDEDEDTCRVVSDVGSAFDGILLEEDPCTSRKPSGFRFIVTSVDINPQFTQEPKIKAAVIIRSRNDQGEEVTEALTTEGIYDYTHRRITLYSPDNDSLVFECTFSRYDDDHCDGEIRRQSGATCAKFGLRRLDD